ncbi:hypothetical protein ABT154_20685 [Streptomyces sp. NPDC001728]|uniref:hypothetical protein n=1 Tax=Streptomyces sp. NPDC001728 TaxID=3154396 RepID=UPI003329B0BA
MPALKASARRVLTATVLAAALALPLATGAHAEECKPDDQACQDKENNAEQAKKIEEDQKKTKEAAGKADKDIKDAGKKLDECPPDSSSCMGKLTGGKEAAAEQGLKDMTDTISSNEPEPANNAAQAVTSTCEAFPGSLPQGSTDPGRSPFPVDQLCGLLGD